MIQLAALSNWRLDYDTTTTGITKQMWNQASMLSGPDRGTYEPVPDSMVSIFAAFAQRAPEGPRAVLPSGPVRDQGRGR